jgi:hypothetical protein
MSEDLIRLRLEADGTQVRGVFQDASASADGLNKTLLKTGEAGQVAGNEIAAGMEKAEYSMMEARHGAMLMSEELGVKMPRAVATLVASVGPVGRVMALAFPVLGALMLIDIISQVADKFSGMGKAAEEAEKKWETMGFEMQDSQNKVREEIGHTVAEIEKLNSPGPVGQLRALENEMNQLSHASSALGKAMQEVLDKSSELTKGEESFVDKWGGAIDRVLSFIPGMHGLAGAIDKNRDSAKAVSEEMENFGEKLHGIISQDGNTAGLKAVDAELNKIYAALQKNPNDEFLIHFKEQLEGIQKTLSLGIDDTFWKGQKLGAEEAVIRTKMLLDVHKILRNAIAETGKISEEQDKQASKLVDEELKTQLEGEKKLNDSILKVGDAQLKLNLTQKESAATIQEDAVARDLATGHIRQAVEEQKKLVSLLELEKQASLAIVDTKIAEAKAAMDVAQSTGNTADYNNALADWTDYQAQRVKVATDADKKISAAQVKMLSEEHKELSSMLGKFNQEFATFFSQSAAGHERLGQVATRMYTSMANSALQALATKTMATLEGLAIALLANEREKISDAKLAAIKAYKAEAAIPIIGPALGAAAAASTFASLMAFKQGGIMPSAAGGMLTDAAGPESGTITMLHPNEMVLPAPLSQTVQDMAASATGAKGGSGVHIEHVHAMDSQSFESFLHKNADKLASGMHRAVDRGHFNIPRAVRGK